MRENKSFEERLQELKDKYDGTSEFDFITILELENEYSKLTNNNPEHTKRRSELLDMRSRLTDRLHWKSI